MSGLLERLLEMIDEQPPHGESSGVHIRRSRTGTWRIEVYEMEIAHDEDFWPSLEQAVASAEADE